MFNKNHRPLLLIYFLPDSSCFTTIFTSLLLFDLTLFILNCTINSFNKEDIELPKLSPFSVRKQHRLSGIVQYKIDIYDNTMFTTLVVYHKDCEVLLSLIFKNRLFFEIIVDSPIIFILRGLSWRLKHNILRCNKQRSRFMTRSNHV